MASTFNFQQGRYDTGYADSLANLSKDFSTIGIQQGRVAQDAISEANNLAYRNARAQAQDTQSAIQNQLSYDNLGINKEKIAIDQYNTKSKNQAAYNTLVQSGRIKEPMQDSVDYSTMFDSLVKNDVTKANIAQSNAAINASNANAAQSGMQTKLLQQQMTDAQSLNQGIVNMYTPQTTEQANPVYTNVQNEYDKLNKSIDASTQAYNNTKTGMAQLSEASKVRTLNPEEQRQLDAYTRYQNAGGSIYSNTGGVSPTMLEERAKLEANLVNTPKMVQVPVAQTTENAINQIVNNKELTPTAKATLLQYVSSSDGNDGISGINLSGSSKSSKAGSNVLGEDTIAEKRFRQQKTGDREEASLIANRVLSANPNLPQEELITLANIKTKSGLEQYVNLNYDKDTGKLKNSPEGKQALVFKSLNDVVAKDDSDNNTTGNITQFYQTNQPVLNKMSTSEINSLMELVSNNYRTQSKSSFANLGDNSPIGDSLDNAITKWNSLHPDKKLNKDTIGSNFSD